MSYRPSAAATPSRLFKRPLRLKVEPSLAESLASLVVAVDSLVVGAPVEEASRETPLVNAASRSYKSRHDRAVSKPCFYVCNCAKWMKCYLEQDDAPRRDVSHE